MFSSEEMIVFLRDNSFIFCFLILSGFIKKTAKQNQIYFISVGLLLSFFVIKVPFKQYFLMAMPFVVMMSAFAISSIFQNHKNLIIVLMVVCLLNSYRHFYNFFDETRRKGIYYGQEQLAKINYVLSITNQEDLVYDGAIRFNIFRKDISFFWIHETLGGYLMANGYNFSKHDTYELIETFEPKVISNVCISNMEDIRIKNYYLQSGRFKDIFIRKKLIN